VYSKFTVNNALLLPVFYVPPLEYFIIVCVVIIVILSLLSFAVAVFVAAVPILRASTRAKQARRFGQDAAAVDSSNRIAVSRRLLLAFLGIPFIRT